MTTNCKIENLSVSTLQIQTAPGNYTPISPGASETVGIADGTHVSVKVATEGATRAGRVTNLSGPGTLALSGVAGGNLTSGQSADFVVGPTEKDALKVRNHE